MKDNQEEVKEVVNEEIIDTTVNQEQQEIEQKEKKPKKKKKKFFRFFWDVVLFIIVIIVILEAVVGIVNMQKIGAGEEPIWYLNKETKEETNKVVTSYNLGLYRIVKTDTPKDTRTVLKLFFIND